MFYKIRFALHKYTLIFANSSKKLKLLLATYYINYFGYNLMQTGYTQKTQDEYNIKDLFKQMDVYYSVGYR